MLLVPECAAFQGLVSRASRWERIYTQTAGPVVQIVDDEFVRMVRNYLKSIPLIGLDIKEISKSKVDKNELRLAVDL